MSNGPSKMMIADWTKRTAFWIIAGGGAFITILFNLDWLLKSNTSFYDLGSFIAAGQLITRGENPYSIDSAYIFEVEFTEAGISGIAPNLNPPISVVIFEKFFRGSPWLLLLASRAISFILYSALIFLLSTTTVEKEKKVLLIFFSFSLAGMWHTLQLGQIYIYLLLMEAAVFYFLRKMNYLAAGIFLGLLAAMKPNLIYWILILGVYGYWKTFIVSGAVFGITSLIPLLQYGTMVYIQWLDASITYTPELLLFPGNNSFQGLTARLGFPETGIFLSIILGVVVAVVVLRYKPNENTTNLLAVTTTLLISPIAWVGYTLMLLPVFWFQNEWKLEYCLAGVIFCVPFLIILDLFEKSTINFIFFGWFYGWGLLILLGASLLRVIKPLPQG